MVKQKMKAAKYEMPKGRSKKIKVYTLRRNGVRDLMLAAKS
jgi:hypothetical protein